MKYLTKYIPVEGKIEEGDTYLYNSYSKEILIRKPATNPDDYSQCIKVKLFLCSRDIQVGDKVWDSHRNRELILEEQKGFLFRAGVVAFDERNLKLAKERYFKIIGEISPEATWVKEGDEFEEDQVQIKYHETYRCLCKEVKGYEDENCSEYSGGTNKYVDGCYRTEQGKTAYEIRIKGPCGHFH